MIFEEERKSFNFMYYCNPILFWIKLFYMKNILTLICISLTINLFGQNLAKTNDSIVNPGTAITKDNQWQSVLVTKNKKDVEGLFKHGEVSASSAMSSRDKKKALESATIKLQKKAAEQEASIVLITREKFTGGYSDEAPGYYVEGISYGKEPLKTSSQATGPKSTDTKTKK